MSRRAVVYRLFDQHARLLYVGVTCGPGSRFSQHAGDKWWWSQVVGSTFEHFDTRAAATAAEAEAIRTERPVYNVAGRPPAETAAASDAHRVFLWATSLHLGADKWCASADLLDAFDLYAEAEASPAVRRVLDRMADALTAAFPVPEEVAR